MRLETVRSLQARRERAPETLQRPSASGEVAAILHKLMGVLVGPQPPDPDLDFAPEEIRGALAVRDGMLRNAAFIVFNFTPLQDPDKRVFVAAVNWDLVPRGVQDAAAEYSAQAAMSYAEPADVMFFSVATGLGELALPAARRLWDLKWRDYERTTRDAPDGRYTWNQFLLKAATVPRTAGINISNTTDANSLYANLTSDDLDAIGIPSMTSAEENRAELLRLPTDAFRLPELRTSGLGELRTLWRRSRSRLSEAQLADNVPWAAFHLLRSYMFWGGNSFISIPITFGSIARDRTAVLSVATESPLSPREVTRWTNVATNVFYPLLAEEAIAMAATAERVTVYEAIGHTLKGVVGLTGWRKMASKMADLSRNFASAPLDKRMHDHLFSGMAGEDDQITHVAQVLEMATETLGMFSLSEGVGGLIRLISITEKGDYTKIRDWASLEAYRAWFDPVQWPALITTYAHSVFVLARLACHSQGWPALRVDYDGGTLRWNYFEQAGQLTASMLDDVHFPPLTALSEGRMTVYPMILEPVLNAAKALLKSPLAISPLRIRVDGKCGEYVSLAIRNRTTMVDPPVTLPSGLKDTALFGKHLKIATFDDAPTLDPRTDGSRDFTIRLRLHPQGLVKAILDHTEARR